MNVAARNSKHGTLATGGKFLQVKSRFSSRFILVLFILAILATFIFDLK